MTDWNEYAKFFAALVAVVNPIGAIPIFVSLTVSQSLKERRRTALLAAASAAMVLVLSLVTGEAILHFFGISIASFRVGGGILILLIAISMMHARVSPTKQTAEEAEDAADRDSVAVVPIGIPLLAGPGAISTVILNANRGSSIVHYFLLAGGVLSVSLIVWGCLRSAPFLSSFLGKTGINIVTRIMGLIMAAIAIEFMANGLRELFPPLAGP
jgi:multiple antibiotic resistance protein